MHCRPLAQDTMAGVGMVSDAWGKMSAASQQAGGWRGVVERGFVAQVMRHPLHTHPRTLGWEMCNPPGAGSTVLSNAHGLSLSRHLEKQTQGSSKIGS
jgi:hypothetical protein